MEFRYFTAAQLMHENKGPVDKVSEDVHQLTIIPFLKVLPGEVIILSLWCIGAEYISKHIFTTREIFQVFIYPYSPIATGGYFITFNIEELISRYIIWQHKISMSPKHGREDDAV